MIQKPDKQVRIECASEDGDCMIILYYESSGSFVFEHVGTGTIVTPAMALRLIGWMQGGIKPASITRWDEFIEHKYTDALDAPLEAASGVDS